VYKPLSGEAIVLDSSEVGMALFDLLIGYRRLIIIDARRTGRHPPGTITNQDPDSLPPATATSPHYTGLSDLIALAKRFNFRFPTDIRIITMEIEENCRFGENLSDTVKQSMPNLVASVIQQVEMWSLEGEPEESDSR